MLSWYSLWHTGILNAVWLQKIVPQDNKGDDVNLHHKGSDLWRWTSVHLILSFFFSQILCPVVQGDFCLGFAVEVPCEQVQCFDTKGAMAICTLRRCSVVSDEEGSFCQRKTMAWYCFKMPKSGSKRMSDFPLLLKIPLFSLQMTNKVLMIIDNGATSC